MKLKIMRIIKRIVKAVLKPFLDDYLTTLSRQNQILLSLKYKEMALAQGKGLDFDQIGFNLFSTTYEDGILLYIFSLIGMTNKKCVDIGAGSITGSSVANLIINHGFKGLLIDGNPRSVKISKEYYANHPETKMVPPQAISALVTRENVNDLLKENRFSGEIDLLCLDIDGIDYWIMDAIETVSPRVLVVEYQDILGPKKALTVPYKPNFSVGDYPVNAEVNNYCGASLNAFVKLCSRKGYRLVGCNKGGWNAFFVKNGIGEKILPAVSAESCFQSDWNKLGMEKRFPLVKDMAWEEV